MWGQIPGSLCGDSGAGKYLEQEARLARNAVSQHRALCGLKPHTRTHTQTHTHTRHTLLQATPSSPCRYARTFKVVGIPHSGGPHAAFPSAFYCPDCTKRLPELGQAFTTQKAVSPSPYLLPENGPSFNDAGRDGRGVPLLPTSGVSSCQESLRHMLAPAEASLSLRGEVPASGSKHVSCQLGPVGGSTKPRAQGSFWQTRDGWKLR